MAIDPKHLPEDSQILQPMVLDLMTQLDRECTERGRSRACCGSCWMLSGAARASNSLADQLALFAAAWQARQAETENPSESNASDNDDDAATPGAGADAPSCEALPLSFVAKHAGGFASNGEQAILDMKPSCLHQSTPFIVGGRVELEVFAEVIQRCA